MIAFLAAAVGAWASGWAWRRALRGPRWIDAPRPGRFHTRATSLAGGPAWITGMIFGSIVGWIGELDLTAFGDGGSSVLLALILGASCLAYLLGEIDDRGKIGPLPKALVQAALVIAPLAAFVALRGEGITTPAVVGLLLALALQIALGIFDNMDGVLGSVSLVGLLFLGASPVFGGAWVASGATAGFLLWNRPSARLFLGNRGSSALATAAAACFACHASTLPTSGALVSALPFAWPLADLAFVTARRLRAGRRPWEGGKDHTTHETARLMGTDRHVWLLVGASAAVGALLARSILRTMLPTAG